MCVFVFFILPHSLLHLAIIHEAKDYIRTMIDVSKNTDFLNTQNDLRQVCVPPPVPIFFPLCSSYINAWMKSPADSLWFFPLQTPLHLAVITNQADVCQHLLVSGCDPTLVDNRGDTPLHIACRHGNLLCFSVITQFCQKEHLHTVMEACNYNGEF